MATPRLLLARRHIRPDAKQTKALPSIGATRRLGLEVAPAAESERPERVGRIVLVDGRDKGERTQQIRTPELASHWRVIGAATGLTAVAAYTLLVAVPLPDKIAPVVASMFGPLVGCASVALYRVLAYTRETVAGFLAAIANVAAGALVVAMLLVQLSLDDAEETARLDKTTERVFDHVHFGLDLSWDTFLCLGTFLFGLAMLRRRGFGPVVGGAGMLIAVALYAVNFATFPEPPGDSAVDLGPVIGLWYGVVSLLLLRPSVTVP